jgi:hypothetical protein
MTSAPPEPFPGVKRSTLSSGMRPGSLLSLHGSSGPQYAWISGDKNLRLTCITLVHAPHLGASFLTVVVFCTHSANAVLLPMLGGATPMRSMMSPVEGVNGCRMLLTPSPARGPQNLLVPPQHIMETPVTEAMAAVHWLLNLGESQAAEVGS